VSRAPARPGGRGSPEDAHAFYCHTGQIDQAQDCALRRLLSIEERARADALGRAEDRRDYVAAHALLRRALAAGKGSAPEELVFERDPHGKPFLVHAGQAVPRDFSLSHSAGLVACAISATHAVGIDVEAINCAIDVSRIATRYFMVDEATALLRCPVEDRAWRFFELWTLKEALLKAAGVDPATTLDSVSFRVDGGRVRLMSAPPAIGMAWTVALTDVGRSHTFATAIGASTSRMAVTQVTPARILQGTFLHEPDPHPAEERAGATGER
jgi:4'-phosphopantetheinyl transferase